VAAAKGLKVGPTAQGALDLEQNLAGSWARRHDLAQFEPARFDEHGLPRMIPAAGAYRWRLVR
jgi:hypothetical protein